MKRAKIMLMTIAVIATVGTALAFKVNKLGSTTYCYLLTDTQPATGGCTNEIQRSTAIGNTNPIYFYTEKTAACNTLVCDKRSESFVAPE